MRRGNWSLRLLLAPLARFNLALIHGETKSYGVRFLLAAALSLVAVASRSADYEPDAQALQRMKPEEARKILRENLVAGRTRYYPGAGQWQRSGSGEEPASYDHFTSVKVRASRLELGHRLGTQVLPLGAIGTIRQKEKVFFYDPEIRILDDKRRFLCEFLLHGATNEQAKDVADALFVLKHAYLAVRSGAEDKEFAEIARSYRAAAVKPELTEGVRRFKVQAERALRDKEFALSAELFEQALEVAPWWPEGHFNRALVLGEIKEYEEAIASMKRYLQLVPDAANARAAQDRIYEWEGLASKK